MLRVVLLAIAGLLLIAATASAGDFCDGWEKAEQRGKMAMVAVLADRSFSTVYSDMWDEIRLCVVEEAVKRMHDITASCKREGDYSGGVAVGLSLQMAVASCVLERARGARQ